MKDSLVISKSSIKENSWSAVKTPKYPLVGFFLSCYFLLLDASRLKEREDEIKSFIHEKKKLTMIAADQAKIRFNSEKDLFEIADTNSIDDEGELDLFDYFSGEVILKYIDAYVKELTVYVQDPVAYPEEKIVEF